MSDFKILTDSTCDLPPEFVEKYDIDVLPLSMRIDGKKIRHYYDSRELSSKDFYDLSRQGKRAKTNPVSEFSFVDYFEEQFKNKKDILYIAFSGALSATYKRSNLGVQELLPEFPGRRVITVDTSCASGGVALLVLKAAEQREAGKSIDEVAQYIEQCKGTLAHRVIVQNLNHLKRGGRVSSSTALIGSLLHIKPMLEVTTAGKLETHAKFIGRAKAVAALIDDVCTNAVNPSEETLFIGHGDCAEDAQYVKNMVSARCKFKNIVIFSVGPVIGTHTGPGVLGTFYQGKTK